MIKNNKKTTWIIDAVLFGGLICAFFMDETGLPFHQWLGIAVGIMSNYHLLAHGRWVKTVAGKFFGKTTGRARIYFVVDLLIAAGLTTIVTSGVVMSTWLDLDIPNYSVWKTVHITSSIITLLITLIKIGLHWKWIAKTARSQSFSPSSARPLSLEARIPVVSNEMVGRREFLKMMGIVSAASILASVKVFDELQNQKISESSSQTIQNDTVQSQSGSAKAEQSLSNTSDHDINKDSVDQSSDSYVSNRVESESSVSCTSPCPKKCPFPGHCPRYTDSNGNRYCDNGECA